MGENHYWKRFVSGALAAQLLCAPTAEALSLTRPIQSSADYVAGETRKDMPRLTLPKKMKIVASNADVSADADEGNPADEVTGSQETSLDDAETAPAEPVVSEGDTPEEPAVSEGEAPAEPDAPADGGQGFDSSESPSVSDEAQSSAPENVDKDANEVLSGETAPSGDKLQSGTEVSSGESVSKEEKEPLTGQNMADGMRKAGAARGYFLPGGLLMARGQDGISSALTSNGVGVNGYRGEMADEGWGVGGWNEWLPKTGDGTGESKTGFYASQSGMTLMGTLFEGETVTVQKPMPRLPNYEFDGWYIYKGLEFANENDMGLSYLGLNQDYTKEPKIVAGDPTTVKGYPFTKGTDMEYTLENWADPGKTQEIIKHLYDNGLLKQASYTSGYEETAIDTSTWTVDDVADKYYALFFSTGWKPSKRAELVGALTATTTATTADDGASNAIANTAGKRPLYTTSAADVDRIAQLSNSDLEQEPKADELPTDDYTTENDGSTSYFTRVESDVDKLTLSVVTCEPGSVVYVEREFNGQVTQYVPEAPEAEETTKANAAGTNVVGTTVVRELVNGPENSGSTEDNDARNGIDKPARSKWTLTIPLEQSQGAEALYNELRIVVVPPADRMGADDGTALPQEPAKESLERAFSTLDKEADGSIAHTANEKVYTVYAQRLNEPELTFGTGNTPAGLIARDGNKVGVLDRFVTNHGWVNHEDEPGFGKNISELNELKFRLVREAASGAVKTYGKYNLSMWTAYAGIYDDYPANPAAGDRLMNPDLDDEAVVVYLDSEVTLPAMKVVDSLGRQIDGVEAERTLTVRTVDHWQPEMCLQETPGQEWTTTATVTVGQPEKLDLRGQKIVPGIYSLEYACVDPITGEDYKSSAKGLFPNTPEKYKTFHRVLVVLPIPGDVNMDGVVTVADGVALEKLVGQVDAATPAEQERANLFLYRVCDVNGDESCNLYDYDMLMRAQGTPLFRSFLGGGAVSDYRYWPLNRAELSNAVSGGSPEPETPVAAADGGKAGLKLTYLGKGETVPGEDADTKTAVNEGETFWVGIELENAAALNQALGGTKAITMTIAVDGRYISPSTAQCDNSYWATTDVGQRFMDNGRLTSEMDLNSRGLTWRAANASKAMTTFDSTSTDGWEYQLSVVMRADSLQLQDGVLVKFPLKMETLPPDNNESNLVELALGMRELCLLGENGVTAAYDCREGNVYRGETHNLKDYLEYRKCDKIPVGEDVSGAEELKNTITSDGSTIYGGQFRAVVPTTAASLTSGTLPQGIEYKGNGVFEGTAWEAGVFNDIELAGVTYSIEVKKASLTLTVQPNERYYGEELRGVEFTYDPEQLQQKDQSAALTGDMDELAAVLGEGYTAPAASGWLHQDNTVTGTPVTTDTAVGTYFVAMSGGVSKNYRFNFYKEGEAPGSTGWSTLTIHKRPVFVDKILTDPVYSKSATTSGTRRAPDDADSYLTGHSVTDFSLVLPETTDGKYNGLPLTGDALHTKEKDGEADDLVIDYHGMYVLGEKDTLAGGILTYHVDSPVEKRDIEIVGIKLQDGGLMGNYELLSDTPKTATVKDGGRLLRDYVKRLRLSNVPADSSSEGNANDPNRKVTMKYTHGDRILMTSFFVEAPTNADTGSSPVFSNYEDAKKKGIEIFWAGLKTDENGKAALDENGQPIPEGERITAENNMPLSRAKMNGLHLWVHVTSYDEVKEEPLELYSYSYSTLDIAQKGLTLSIGPEERYYGEPNTADNKTDVTYTVSELSPADQEGKTGKFWADFSAENLPGYVAPKVKWITRLGEDTPVEQGSQAYEDHYYVTISEAASTDYFFNYVQKKRDGTTTTVTPKDPLYLGCNTFKVYPRPIIVTRLNDVVDENGIKSVPREIYADDAVYSFTESAQAGSDAVSVALPAVGGGQVYQTRDAGEKEDGRYPVKPDGVTVTLPLTGDPVYDEDKVTVSYQTSYIPDRESGNVHFDLSTDHETRVVNLTDVTITDNDNYILLFTNVENTQYGYPGTAVGQTDVTEHQTTGTVRVREITSVVIKEPLPQLTYDHGDSLTLDDADRLLTVEVAYKNGTTKSFEYLGGTFANAGIHLTWDAPWAKDADNKELLDTDDMVLSRTEHDGHQLYITVEQLGNLPPMAATPLTITVNKKSLEVAAVKQYRYFGEENATYEFSFNTGDLAEADRRVLREWGGGAALPATLSGAEAVNALQKINEQYASTAGYVAYTSPVLECEATSTSSPGAGEGTDGVYPLTIAGGAMTNYTFTYADGFVRVFKRPIFISRITANPVATLAIESNMTAKQVTLSQSNGVAEEATMDIVSLAGRYYNRFDPDYTGNASEFDPHNQGLPLTGNPIVTLLREDGTDGGTLYVTMTVNFEPRAQRPQLSPDVGTQECTVTISDMTLDEGVSATNYCLVTDTNDPTVPSDSQAKGLYTARKIREFSVQRQPSLNFRYGNSTEGTFTQADLRAITFNVSYESAGMVSGMSYDTLRREVTPEIYYWDPTWPIPGADYLTAVDTTGMTTAEAEAAQKAYITQKVTEALADKAAYKVSMGDRMSRTTIEKDGVTFAHQGMALLIAVRRQEMEDEDYAVPVVTSTTINIARRNIAYDVTADDKVYDGTVATTGQLTVKEGYSGDDVRVDADAIRFNFIDPNVAYVDPAAGPHNYGELDTVTVEVSDIRLIGHDADNYSIDAFIGRDYTPTAEGRPSAAPEATIKKASRPAPVAGDFDLSVDNHTNVLTVTHSGTPVGDDRDAHNSEIHFEYALGRPVALEETPAEGKSLTAEDFDIEITPWQDGRWFGGEKVGDVQTAPEGDADFGKRDPLPKDTWFRVDVRIGESWNYLPSPSIYSIEKDAFLVQAGLLEPAEGESVPTGRTAAKTYRYRLDLYSLPEKRDEAVVLREIWFNDIDRYQKADDLDLAIENEKNVKGYYDYYWDSERRNMVRFPWDLSVPQTIRPGDGSQITIPDEGNTALYATLVRASTGGNIPTARRELIVEPTSVEAHLGDAPFQMTATVLPDEDMKILWRTSDKNVVDVDENGLLTFVGVGEAIITVSVQYSKLKLDVPVVVWPADPRPYSPYAGKLLDVYNTDAFMMLDKYMEFHPNWTMNRGEVALIMARLLIEPEDEKPGEAIRFSDITPGTEMAQAVEKLSKWGIVNGIPDGGFQPERDITRAEVVVMISRMLRLKKGPETTAFRDASISVTWAAPYLKELVEADVIRGVGDSYFAPGRVIIRSEMAAMIARLLATCADEANTDLVVPADVDKSHWAYEYILRAVNSNAVFIETKKD